MRLAPARPRDAASLSRIVTVWQAETLAAPAPRTRRETRQTLHGLIRRAEVMTLRSWRGPQGFVARDGVDLHALYLAPGLRGQGYGKRLLDAAKTGVAMLSLWTPQANARARAFYLREGFIEVEWGDGSGNDAGVPDVRLEWQDAGVRI